MKSHARHKARSLALQAIFQWQFTTSSIDDIAVQYLAELNPKKVDAEYLNDLLRGTTKNIEAIDEVMTPFLDRKLKELNQVERAVLRLAIYELMYRPDVPYKVIINEALELAKKFGSIEGYKYVNGVLDKIAHSAQIKNMRQF
ncbi:MAG: transcriptional terminator NusB [uncultured bacterium]|nr:MAG: transcriptional terminator NusB [uncultured bacterium]